MTDPIRLVSYKLNVEPIDWEDVWYKDEGGRDKCMTVQVELRKADGSVVIGRQVPLQLLLVYADAHFTPLHNQNLLHIFGGTQHQCINAESGKSVIRFRIHDVSKNHQGQDFILQISADATQWSDVAPGYTPAVSVRSKKRNVKRPRSGPSLSKKDGTNTTTDSHPSKPKAAKKNEVPREKYQPNTSRSSSITNNVACRENPAQHSPPLLPPPPDVVTPLPIIASPKAGYAARSAAAVKKALFSVEEPQPAILPPLYDNSFHRMDEPITNITTWAEDVVSGLFPLQWTVVGYATLPNGTVDYSRPYHSMSNPNNFITNILSR